MPTYNYKCPICGKLYKEYRTVTDPQWMKNCDIDGAEYQEVTE